MIVPLEELVSTRTLLEFIHFPEAIDDDTTLRKLSEAGLQIRSSFAGRL
jgi:hypothetical protein